MAAGWYLLGSSRRNPPKPVDLNEEFKKQGLTEEEIKELYKRWDEELERKKKHWFWKLFGL